ncbi:MAG TPA: diacylglycerol kinase family protein [Myxococcota bacterium]|nr:diacylglycerol kinase family protein [Myxococcota bacterium]HQK50894.1 diacylglycerol kinase family protein [Myxococcota bacterium]
MPAIPLLDLPETGRHVPVRLGVLTNPAAQHNHRFPFTHGVLERELASELDGVMTVTRDQVDEAVGTLLGRGINVLAINGGDGTIHGVINALVRQIGAEVSRGLRPFPRLLFLNGGTYNMASRAMGTKGSPVRTVRRFLARHPRSLLAQVPTRPLRLLEIREEGRPEPLLGMVFGSEVVRNALALCEELGSGYGGLLRLLGEGSLGALLGNGFFQAHQWRLRPSNPADPVVLDGEEVAGVTAVVASTIDLKLVRGAIWSLAVPPGTEGFAARLIRSRNARELVRLLPHLLWQWPHPLIRDVSEGRRISLRGDYTLDGELYRCQGRLSVSLSPHRLEVVAGEAL